MALCDFYETTLRNPFVWNMYPESRGIWFETEQDRALRKASRELYKELQTWIFKLMADELSPKQRQVLELFLLGKKQGEIAAILGRNQSTISRTLFGIKRKGKPIGGIVRKMQKIVNGPDCPPEITAALEQYRRRRREVLDRF